MTNEDREKIKEYIALHKVCVNRWCRHDTALFYVQELLNECERAQGDQVAEASEKRAHPLIWTTRRPTESGWYWYADERHKIQCVQVSGICHNINVVKEDRQITFWNDFSEWMSKLSGIWAGPIPEPSLDAGR